MALPWAGEGNAPSVRRSGPTRWHGPTAWRAVARGTVAGTSVPTRGRPNGAPCSQPMATPWEPAPVLRLRGQGCLRPGRTPRRDSAQAHRAELPRGGRQQPSRSQQPLQGLRSGVEAGFEAASVYGLSNRWEAGAAPRHGPAPTGQGSRLCGNGLRGPASSTAHRPRAGDCAGDCAGVAVASEARLNAPVSLEVPCSVWLSKELHIWPSLRKRRRKGFQKGCTKCGPLGDSRFQCPVLRLATGTTATSLAMWLLWVYPM